MSKSNKNQATDEKEERKLPQPEVMRHVLYVLPKLDSHGQVVIRPAVITSLTEDKDSNVVPNLFVFTEAKDPCNVNQLAVPLSQDEHTPHTFHWNGFQVKQATEGNEK